MNLITLSMLNKFVILRRLGYDDLRRGGQNISLKEGEQLLAAQNTCLDGLGRPARKDVGGQGLQAACVADHGGGLHEGPSQIFPGGQVDGRLASHRGVHRRQQGGGQLDIFHPPQVQRGGQPRHISSDAAAQRGHAVRAGELLPGQELQNIGQGIKIFVALSSGKDIGTDLESRL